MKILFLGEIGVGQTSLMRMRALAKLGHDVRACTQSSHGCKRLGANASFNAGCSEVQSLPRSTFEFLKRRAHFIRTWFGLKSRILLLETLAALRKLGARGSFTLRR